jgi:hypothetical protein
MSSHGHSIGARLIKLVPFAAGFAWLTSFLLTVGPIASGSAVTAVAFGLFTASLGVALVSYVWERRVPSRSRLPSAGQPIDWAEFDRARQSWHDGELV